MDEPQAPLTERERFERWANIERPSLWRCVTTYIEQADVHLLSAAWLAWQARAALASAPHPPSNTLGDASGPGDPVASLPTPPIATGDVRSGVDADVRRMDFATFDRRMDELVERYGEDAVIAAIRRRLGGEA